MEGRLDQLHSIEVLESSGTRRVFNRDGRTLFNIAYALCV